MIAAIVILLVTVVALVFVGGVVGVSSWVFVAMLKGALNANANRR